MPVDLLAAPPVGDWVLRLFNIRSTEIKGKGSPPLPLLLQAAAYDFEMSYRKIVRQWWWWLLLMFGKGESEGSYHHSEKLLYT